MTAVLQAQQQFVLPAFATSIFNIGIIIAAVILAPWLGPIALAIGMVLGAALQVALQYYGLRQSKLTWRTDWSDPSIREMLRLYAPVALGMGFSAIGTLIDRRYATDFGAQVLPTMRYATTLIQFPLGLVAAAVSTAILPSLARLSDSKSLEQFRSTVGTALTVVIALIVPASVVLWLIRVPLTALILQRQAFSVADTQAVANTLMYYIPGLPAAAIDQILLFACYARGRTLAPNLVQGGAIIAYVLGVWLVMPWLGHSAETLAMANSIQWIAHMLLMALLCQQQFDLRGLAVGQTLVLCVMAAAVTWVTVQAVMTVVVISQVFVQVIVIAGLTGVVYLVVAWLLGITPVLFAADLIRQRITAVIMRVRPTPP
jgi:putative peptidoglycan lipid II flippase